MTRRPLCLCAAGQLVRAALLAASLLAMVATTGCDPASQAGPGLPALPGRASQSSQPSQPSQASQAPDGAAAHPTAHPADPPGPERRPASDASPAASQGAQAPRSPSAAAAPQAFDTQQVTTQFGLARQALDRRFRGFLTQTPLGFDRTLGQQLLQDLKEQTARYAQLGQALRQISALDFFLSLLPLALALSFVTALSILDRQATRWSNRWQGRQHIFFLPEEATPLWRAAIALLGQLSALGGLILLSYFPVRAIFGAAPWCVLLTDTLWLLWGARAMTSLAELSLGLWLTDVRDDHADRLRLSAHALARFVMFAIYPALVLRALDYRAEAIALAHFLFDVGLALYLVLAWWGKRDAISALMPAEHLGGPLYRLVRRTFIGRFRAVLVVTSTLLVMLAFGYERASLFLLARGYGLFGLILVAVWLTHMTRRALEARVRLNEHNRTQAELWQSVGHLATLLILLTFISAGLELVGLYEPLILLLKAPLVTVQTVQFSIYNAMSAALIVGSAALISKVIRLALNARVYPTLQVDVGAAYAINTIINYLIIVLGFFMVLVALGVNLAALTVVAASLSVGIGFGLQTLTENLISGVILLFGQAVKKGDYVTVGGVYGRVEAVGARSVIVRTPDNYDMLIPSKELVNGSIINWTYRDSHVRLRLPVKVAYSADPRQVKAILLRAAQDHPKVLETPSPEVWFVGFGDSAIDFQLLIFFDCHSSTPDRMRGELYFSIWDRLKEAGVEIPLPQRDLHLRSVQLNDEELERLRAIRPPPSR